MVNTNDERWLYLFYACQVGGEPKDEQLRELGARNTRQLDSSLVDQSGETSNDVKK